MRISTLDPDHFNVVKFYEKFEYFGCTCLVFELLAMDLLQFIRTELHFCSMYVHQIRPIAKQMLVALQGLQSRWIIHSDIKLDNVMLANHEKTPYKVKLIDFGLAIPSSAARCGMQLQPIGSRAPEICLGLPFTEAIDMWGLGCMLADLYLDQSLFPVNCEYLMMKAMVEFLGMPPDYQLCCGVYTKKFFCQEEDEFGSRWRLLTPEEYSANNDKKAEEWPAWRCHFKSWDDLLYIFNEEDAEELEDRRAFIDFLKQVLHQDGGKRISPTEALQHPFITMSHLSQDPGSSDYLTEAQSLMSMKRTNEDIDEEHKVQLSPSQVLLANSWESDEVHGREPFDQILTPASSQIEPLSDVNNDNGSVKEPSLDWGEEFNHNSSVDDSGIFTLPHCGDENLESFSSVNGPVVEDVPIPAPKRFRNVRKFFSRIRKTFFGCFCCSVQE
ncbi:homeodomain-interacting protein kinase 2-like [Gouania willdenowi]|uniref:homeodomain-interacting protein kinase 2-like n=1 Tax=Gouania willdenowi TaxID=441366 RepID=UPI001056A2F8|nr:homeodomain-interacting protein kinase 2-like [Gouania willdenowi]